MAENKIIRQIKFNLPTISVNMVECDLLKIAAQVKEIEKSGNSLLHFDVKDGCFVPQMTFGPCFIKSVKTKLLKNAHLMIHDPAEKIKDFIKAGADIITLHIESDYALMDTLAELGTISSTNNSEHKIIRGIAMNPDIPVEDLAPFLDYVELVTVMAYNPKVKNGQIDDKFKERVKKIKKMIEYTKNDILLSVSGGINKNNIKEIAGLGADILVIGKAVFDKGKIVDNINELKSLIN